MATLSPKCSTTWRQEGNQHFLKGSKPNFQNAICCYHSALQLAQTPQEALSCQKNLAVTHLKLLLIESLANIFTISQVAFHFCEMMQFFTICIYNGPKLLSLEWNRKLTEKYSEANDFIFNFLSRERKGRLFWRLTKMSEFCVEKIFPVVLVKVWLNLAQNDMFFAVRKREEEDFVSGFNCMMNCNFPFENSKKLVFCVEGGERFQIEEEVEGVGEQIKNLQISLESGKLRQQGLKLLQEAMEDEDYDIEKVWLVTDYLKQAILKARGNDLEAELIATAEIGRVFSCLQLKTVARAYFKHVIEAAEALKPKIVHSESWYQMAMNGLTDIRGALWEQEEKAKREQKKPILEKLKPELGALEEAEKKSVYEFLAFLFDKHPPKSVEGWKKPEKIDLSTGKNLCRKACAWYHPDKNQKFGLEWEVLCEEILKMVSKKYAIFKE